MTLTEAVELGSVVQTVVVVVGVVVAVIQVHAATMTRIGESLYSVLQDFHLPERDADRRIVLNSAEAKLANPDPETKQAMQRVVEFHELTALMISQRLLPHSAMMSMYSHLFATSWLKLEPFVKHVRTQSGAINYASFFERFALECIKFRAKKYGHVGISISAAIASYGINLGGHINEPDAHRRTRIKPGRLLRAVRYQFRRSDNE